MFSRKLAYGAAASVLALAAASAAYAQETTGGVRGQVTDEAGAPVANATVTIRHEPTGTTATTVTGADGFYSARGLRVGGPYTITVTASEYGEEQAQIAALGVGSPELVDIILFSANTVEEVVVTASAGDATAGPGSNINEGRIRNLPSISRDLKDVARLDPFVVVGDPDNQDAMSFAGANTRFNQLTVDGIRQNDDFGLNNNGYPTQRSPISLDAVEAVQVSVAPFSVINNGFLGGSINAVTKSGTNDLRGSVFYEFSDDSLRGDSLTTWDNRAGSPTRGKKARIAVNAPFEEKVWGATLGGPIIQDTLFFFASYEKFESTFSLDEGPAGSGKTTEIPRITVTAIDNFRAGAIAKYGIDPGGYVDQGPPVEDEKILGKLDWNINDDHRLSLTYQNTKGTSFNGSVSSVFAGGSSTSSSTPRVGLSSYQYVKDEQLTTLNAQLNSDWTDNFSTELRIGHKETETERLTPGLPVGEITVNVADLPGVTAGTGTPQIRFGTEINSQPNYLNVKVDTIELIGRYSIGSHDLLFGARTEKDDVLNIFGRNYLPNYTFNSYADFLAGNASGFSMTGAVDPSGGTVDATPGTAANGAAEFDFRLNSLYVEDTWRHEDVSVLFGLRYDWFSQDDVPVYNANFESRQGFSNQQNLDGRSVILPRLFVQWRPTDDLELSFGTGRYSSQGLNVWISNPYANDGARVTNVGGGTACTGAQTNVDLTDAPAACTFTPGNGNVNVLDPNFKIPTAFKTNLGLAYDFDLGRFGDDWRFKTDLLYTVNQNSALWRDLRAVQIGTAPDGRPVYGRSSTGVTGGNVFDMVLTNANDGGSSRAAAFSLSKGWHEGLWDGLSGQLSYTWTDAEDANPMTSSIADSSYVRFASFDHQNPKVATSDYEIRHRTALQLNYERKFFGDNKTNVGLFAQRRSGQPFSYTFHSSRTGNFDNDFGNLVSQSYSGLQATSNQLFYVPQTDASGNVTATSDPSVTFVTTGANAINLDAFNRYLRNTGLIKYAGGIAPRNAFRGEDVTTVDLHFSQEIPAFFPGGAKVELYFDVENVGNMLNDEWGVLEQYTFYRGVPVANVRCIGATGSTTVGCQTAGARYEYSQLQTPAGSTVNDQAIRPFPVNNASLWQIKWGVRYRF